MSVRRLAADAVQPATFAFTAENQSWAEKVIARYPAGRQQSAVILILWRAQEQQGWLSRAAIEAVGRLLGMAYIRVLEVATFYTQFLLKPVGSEAHIIVCGTTPCMLRGASDLLEVCQNKIAHGPLEISADGKLSWEEAECLGACVNAPMIMIGNDTYEDLTVESFEAIVESFRAGNGKSVPAGTQIKRENAAAEGGRTTLLDPPTAKRTYKAFPPPPPPPAAASAGPAPSAAAAPPATPPAAQQPTSKGNGSETTAESAPGLKGPPNAPKVSEGKADGERKAADVAPNANGEPNRAMRETATGAGSSAGNLDGGKAAGAGAAKTLFAAAAGPADNLKQINGIGPGLEKALNGLGITTFAQVAKLSSEQIGELESELGFKGRVVRDDWLKQADALARGGVDEYVRVFGKKPK